MRLQVYLSHNGICSRREAMRLIQAGRVKLNGQINREPSTAIDPQADDVIVDGKKVDQKRYDYIMLNKPAGYVTTTAEFKNEKNVLELLPVEWKHLLPVGRLDRDTEGLLVFTNDGALAQQLTHPKFDVDKKYCVCIDGILTPGQKKQLEQGVAIEEQLTAPCLIEQLKISGPRTEFVMTIHEGRKRQIRLMLYSVGHKVIYLKRLAQGPLVLGDLPAGHWRTLTAKEIETIKNDYTHKPI